MILRRFEIVLPKNFNDGSPVPNSLIGNTIIELRSQFGALSAETQTIQGFWSADDIDYEDENARLFIDVEDNAASMDFMRAFKETLKARFQQLDIWMVCWPIEVV